MKGLKVTVLLVLCIWALEALKCNNCASEDDDCTSGVEECENANDTCGTVTISFPFPAVYKGCMTPTDVAELSNIDHCTVVTCLTDLCN